ncbi:hypothetical protein F511_40947 [Dorcoceras hygrometricum]|uniref:Uncharacterized protein n=1 Tax=Dorcoceras hygrometricum TaxID=472368 RepID=A0A2Z7CGK4_9LAMI|nr:hypothetical protein F511_40947 [Dorcoceras hygrometricum]
MASSLISNSHHIDFDTVFGMEDTDLVQMFESLIAIGLKHFLGCPAVFNEAALTELFANSSVREDGLVVSTVNGVTVEILREVFAATFELPAHEAENQIAGTEQKTDTTATPPELAEKHARSSDALEPQDPSTLPVEEPVGVSTTSEQPVAEVATGEREPVGGLRIASITEATTGDADAAIEQVLAQLDLVIKDSDVERGDRIETWFDRALDEEFVTADQENQDSEDEIDFDVDNQELPVFDETRTVPEAGGSKSFGVAKAGHDAAISHCSRDYKNHESINIHDVQERDLLYASLPKISIHYKGKEPLVEDEPVIGNPARESVELICGDVDFLVQLRNKVMQDVVELFHSFSLNKLSDLDSLQILKEKEKLMLEWAETDSLEMAVRRRVYILAKYREMLLRKFLESHRKYHVPGQPWTATASQIIDLLSVVHSQSLETLLAQRKEHGLLLEQSCSSTFFDDSVGSGAVLAQFFSLEKSTCWIRPMVQIDGVWTPIQGPDFWRSSCKLSLFVNKRQVPESMVDTDFVPHGFFIEPVQYWGAAPSLIKTWAWRNVCTEIIRYGMFGCLRPVFREIVVYNLGVERIPDYLISAFQKGVCTDTFVGYFSGSSVQTDPEIELSSSDGDTVYRSPSPIFQETDSFEENLQFSLGLVVSTNALEEKLYYVESPESPPPIPQRQESYSSSSDSQMNFDTTDIPLDDTAEAQTSLLAATVDLFPLLDDLKTSLSQRMDDAHSDIFSRLHTIERSLQNNLGNQNDYFRNLIQSARQEGQTQDDLQILRVNELKKTVMAQGVTADTDSLAIRNSFNSLDAKILLLYGQVAAIRSEQLEFQAKIAADLLSLSTQIGDLVDYIRGGDAKNGEGSSSRRPLPTPVTQGESSGNVIRTTEIISPTDIDAAQRDIMERMMRADRERDRERRERRLSRSGSYKRRRGY